MYDRHPADAPRTSRCVKQVLHLKTLFSLNHQFLCWSPKSPLMKQNEADEADLQEHKRHIAKRAQPSVLCIVLVS